jgi:DNA polymerase-3 subunit gamma/tau
MDNFIVSARKYRPNTFKSVVGQDAITTTLKNSIIQQQIAQAFLFCGPRGVGKTTCARIFAKTINCQNRTEDGEACNTCSSCTSFNASASFNIFELDAASNNGVDEMRRLVEQVRIPPQGVKYKVYIIDEVHMLTSQAFNAFLKTLEEPPSYAKFILATTEKHKILATILSRCQIFDFKRIGINDIVRYLGYVAANENIVFEEEALHIIAQKADGGLRDALSTFDQVVSFSNGNLTYNSTIENLNILDYDYFFKMIDFILSENTAEALLLYNDILERGFEGQHFLSGINEHLRNLSMCKTPSTVKLIEVSDQIRNNYLKQAQEISVDLLVGLLTLFTKCDAAYKASNNKRLHVEVALIQSCYFKRARVRQS